MSGKEAVWSSVIWVKFEELSGLSVLRRVGHPSCSPRLSGRSSPQWGSARISCDAWRSARHGSMMAARRRKERGGGQGLAGLPLGGPRGREVGGGLPACRRRRHGAGLLGAGP